MAKCTLAHGATSVIRHVRALDSSEPDGSGKTGLAFGDFTAKYIKPAGTLTALTTETIAALGTYAAPTSNAHIRIKELSNADPTKGVYEVQFHNDWFAAGEMFTLFLSATDMADLALEIQLGPQEADVTQIGGQAISGNNATLKLKQLDIQNSAGTAVVAKSTGGNGIGLDVAGNGTGDGVAIAAGATGEGVNIDATSGSAVDMTTAAGSALKLSGTTHGVEIAASGGPGVEIDGTTYGVDCVASAGPGIVLRGTTLGIECVASAGTAVSMVSSGGNGNAALLSGNGSGAGLLINGGATGRGLDVVGGSTSGPGAKIWANGTNDVGLEIAGLGSEAGVKITGGATGAGIDINGGGTSGAGVDIDATSGSAVDATTAAGSALKLSGTTHGAEIAASAGPGVEIDGTTFGVEIDASAGIGLHIGGTTHGAEIAGSAGPGVEIDGTTYGIDCVASAGPGFLIQGTTYGVSAQATGGTGVYACGQDTNGHGIMAKGDDTAGGTGRGIYAVGGSAGAGIEAVGGDESGAGIKGVASANNDAGMELVKHGTGKDLDTDEIASIETMATSAAAWGSINSGVVFRGTVTAADPGVSFTIGGLAGQGAGAFVDVTTPWYAYVFRDAGGAGDAPQGEHEEVTGYTTASGLFTTDAFTVPVAVGDDVIIMSGRLAAVPEIAVNVVDIQSRLPAALVSGRMSSDAVAIAGSTTGAEIVLAAHAHKMTQIVDETDPNFGKVTLYQSDNTTPQETFSSTLASGLLTRTPT